MLSDVQMFILSSAFMAAALGLFIAYLVMRYSTFKKKRINAAVSCVGTCAVFALWILIIAALIGAGGSIGLALLLPLGSLGFIGFCWALKLDKI